MSGQSSSNKNHPDPLNCPHASGRTVGEHRECTYGGGRVWVMCTESICGEEPKCSYAPIDNSPEAMARRVEWMRAD